MAADLSTGLADLLLRGAVGGVLLFHLIHLLLPGPRAATRVALAMFTVSLIGYLFCQRAELLFALPQPFAVALVALCVSTTAWLWLAARGLFDDAFALTPLLLAAALGLMALGLAANLPRLNVRYDGLPDPGPTMLAPIHAAAMLAFTAAAVWEMARGWRDDLVEPRRAVRRWIALGIGLYASVALVVELAVRERQVGALLPALHVAGIGSIALALAVLVARRSIGAILGLPPDEPAAPTPKAEPPVSVAAQPSPALAALTQAMGEQRLYRREGLTLAALAQALGMGEAALRALINQQLGYRNFNDFLHHYRLQAAAARLTTEDLPILTIALDSGYGSIGPFNRAFRQRFGMTPTEYRAAARMERHRQASGAA
ncbi:MAG TPA: helix-turn-helix transcriptional regulator [Burkholderiaceae bacterium]|nr:helix-turn-helix transcriptional regulator [Burkholderiaceae bacterium]